MYLNKDREQAPKSSKKMIIAATAGLACVGVATVGYMSQQDSADFDMIELNSAKEAAFGRDFHEKVAGPCDDYYHNAAKAFLHGQDAFLPQAKFLWENKNLLVRYGQTSYRTTMNAMIDSIEGLADSQRELENKYYYVNKYMRLVNKNVSKKKWRVVLKWSEKISSDCIEEEQTMVNLKHKLETNQKASSAALTSLASTFERNAKKDYAKWDCEAMYPMPQKFEVKILDVLKDAATQGFQIFNQVKGMLPEGAMKGMKIPGLPAGIQAKVGSAVNMFNQGKAAFEKYAPQVNQVISVAQEIRGGTEEEFEDFEMDMNMEEDLEELGFIGGESKKQYAERVADRNKYVAMCQNEKKVFGQTIAKTSANLKKLGHHNFVKSTVGQLNDATLQAASDYSHNVKSVYKSTAMMTSSEESAFASRHLALWNKMKKNEQFVENAKREALIKKAMLLQTGQKEHKA